MEKYTEKQQAENFIEWVNRLPNFKKTTGQLGKKENEKWSYCCLGVGCRINHINSNEYSDGEDFYKEGTDGKLRNILGLRSDSGLFKRNTGFTFNGYTARSLVNLNDSCFENDSDFKNMRNAILLNVSKIMKSRKAASIVNKHFAKEIKQLRAKHKKGELFK